MTDVESFRRELTEFFAGMSPDCAPVCQRAGAQRFATFCLARVEGDGRRLTYCNAAAEHLLGNGLTATRLDDLPHRFGMYHAQSGFLLQPDELPLTRAVRGEESGTVEVYVNNVAVCDPIILDEEIASPTFALLGGVDEESGGSAEFERLTFWRADGLPTPEGRGAVKK